MLIPSMHSNKRIPHNQIKIFTIIKDAHEIMTTHFWKLVFSDRGVVFTYEKSAHGIRPTWVDDLVIPSRCHNTSITC